MTQPRVESFITEWRTSVWIWQCGAKRINMSLFPNSHGVCEEWKNKHPHSQWATGKAVPFNKGCVSTKVVFQEKEGSEWESYFVEKGVCQWMRRVKEGQQKWSGYRAGNSKRMSKGEERGDGNRKRSPEGLTFRMEARHGSGGEEGKATSASLESLFGPLATRGLRAQGSKGIQHGSKVILCFSMSQRQVGRIELLDLNQRRELYVLPGLLEKCIWAWVLIN